MLHFYQVRIGVLSAHTLREIWLNENEQVGRQLAYAAAMRCSQIAAQVPIHIIEQDGVVFVFF